MNNTGLNLLLLCYSAALYISISFLMIIVCPAYSIRSGEASIQATFDTLSPGC